jgi:hypothetical protein
MPHRCTLFLFFLIFPCEGWKQGEEEHKNEKSFTTFSSLLEMDSTKPYQRPPPSLDVRLVEARCLPDDNYLSKPSVYAILSFNGIELARTAVAAHTTDPQWNHALTIDNLFGDDAPAGSTAVQSRMDAAQLGVAVMEQNSVLADKLLGAYALSIAGLVEGEVLDKWVVLTRGSSGGSGEVRLRLKANGFGRQSAAIVMGTAVGAKTL